MDLFQALLRLFGSRSLVRSVFYPRKGSNYRIGTYIIGDESLRHVKICITFGDSWSVNAQTNIVMNETSEGCVSVSHCVRANARESVI